MSEPWNEIRVGFHPRILGTPAPVFPGFEVDICEHVPDADKPDAIWHRERSRQMLRQHPQLKQLIGRNPRTAFWCVLFAGLQVGLAVAASAAFCSLGLFLLCGAFFGAERTGFLFLLFHGVDSLPIPENRLNQCNELAAKQRYVSSHSDHAQGGRARGLPGTRILG